MKIFSALIALTGVVSPAFAETIELFATPGFENRHQYHNVKNSAGAAITIRAPENNTWTTGYVFLGFVTVGDVQYMCHPMVTLPGTKPNTPTTTKTACVDVGITKTAVLTLTETWECEQINRLLVTCEVMRWTLLGGMLERASDPTSGSRT